MRSKKLDSLAFGLLDIGAIRFGQFKLKLHETRPDAPLSPIYIDLRIVRSFPSVVDLAVGVYEDLISGLKFDLLADVPTAATPLVAVLAHETRVPMISPRLDQKAHGRAVNIDGKFEPGQEVLVVDDLITLADSKLQAISLLEENGLVVHHVIVLVDREQGGVAELQGRGYSCHAAYRLTEMLGLYLESGKITSQEYQLSIKYLTASSN